MTDKGGKMLTFVPPKASSDRGRRRVYVGNGRVDVHIGWIDARGFYPRLLSVNEVVLLPDDLYGLEQEVAFLKNRG